MFQLVGHQFWNEHCNVASIAKSSTCANEEIQDMGVIDLSNVAFELFDKMRQGCRRTFSVECLVSVGK